MPSGEKVNPGTPAAAAAAAAIVELEGDWGEGNDTAPTQDERPAAFSRTRERSLLVDHLRLRPDGITVLLGPHDSGKTCLLRELMQQPRGLLGSGLCSLDLRYLTSGDDESCGIRSYVDMLQIPAAAAAAPL